MTRRTIVGATLALIAAAAIPLGLPRVASAAGFDSIVFSPGPIAQAGALSTPSTVVDICVQPESGGAHVPGTVWLSIDSGKFTSPTSAGGTAMVGATALTSTPQSFATAATCSFTGPVGTAKDGVQVIYTSPSSAHTNGRDVITAADSSAELRIQRRLWRRRLQYRYIRLLTGHELRVLQQPDRDDRNAHDRRARDLHGDGV